MDSRVFERDTPRLGDRGLLAALRADLEAADFTAARVEAELAAHRLSARPAERLAQLRRLRDGGGFAVLARVFLLRDSVEVVELQAALASVDVRRLGALGLCEIGNGRVRATVQLVPHGDYLLACDPDAPASARTPFDYVPGVQAPSVTLAKLAVRTPVESALDLGTGSGLQALLAAKHCRRVLATDVNRRALAFAAFNARLNELDNVELRHGATFDRVADERFDLIVSNPPYVISPDHTYAYRDSELAGDELCRRIVEGAPAHLKEGGFAHVLVSWAQRAGADWDAAPRSWVRGRGCDAWLLHYHTSDPLAHALGWLQPLGEDDGAAFAQALDRWVAHLREREIESVAYGAVVLRRRAGDRNWIQSAQLPLERLRPASAHTLRVFAANDLLERVDDDRALLCERLCLTPNHRLRQTLTCREGFRVQDATLELTDGLGFGVGVDRYTTLLLPHLDGTRPLSEALQDASTRLELTDEGRERFAPAAMPVVRRLLELGFLE